MRGARRLVLVLLVGEIPLVKHQAATLKGNIPATEWGTPSGKNPTTEGFDSRRIAERVPVGMSILTLPSWDNPISRVYRHNLPSGENPISGELTLNGGNPISRELIPSGGKSHQWRLLGCLRMGKIPSSGRVD